MSNDNWGEYTINWINQPTGGTLRHDNIYWSSSMASQAFGIEPDIYNEHNGDNNASFMLRRASEDGALRECGFWSREYTAEQGKRAQLWVDIRAYW